MSDTALQGTVLRICLSAVERCLRDHSAGCPADVRIGAITFIHRYGSSLNEHVHFHCCVIDGVFEPVVAPDEAPCVSFHAALAHELDAAAFAGVQARVRTGVLRSFVKRGLIDQDDAAEMRAWAHDGGFSVDGSVRIERAPTGQGSNVCCGIVPVRLSRLRICTNAMPCIWSTAIPSRWAQWRPAHARRRRC